MKHWLNVAPTNSWEESLRLGICGVTPAEINRVQWMKVQPRDIVLFYATTPVKGLIGWGRVIERFEEQTPIWPQEKRVGHVLWPFRMRIAVEFIIPQDDWIEKRVKLDPSMSVQRSLMPLSETLGIDLVAKLKKAIEDKD